jgi:hypothetical protein
LFAQTPEPYLAFCKTTLLGTQQVGEGASPRLDTPVM